MLLRKRFIPARAGEALPRCTSSKLEKVHPRSCGGGLEEAAAVYEQTGSSPLVRGRLFPP